MPRPLVVIIEDQINLALLYEDALRLVGYDTVTIRNGLEALNHLQLNDVPDLVILDVNLPGMSGRDILKHIRSRDKYEALPVIILTANSLMVTQMQKETTALDYLFVKPISMIKLQELAKSFRRVKDNKSDQATKTQKTIYLDNHGNKVADGDDASSADKYKTEPINDEIKQMVKKHLEKQARHTPSDAKAESEEHQVTKKADSKDTED